MNEIRAAFDHAMRLMKRDSDKGIDDEFDKAQGHLFRAAYDACELITLDRLGRTQGQVPVSPHPLPPQPMRQRRELFFPQNLEVSTFCLIFAAE